MGQRHQIYIGIKLNNKIRPIGAWHHQWTFGVNAATNFCRLYNDLNEVLKLSYPDYYLSDDRTLNSLVCKNYGVNIKNTPSIVHNETNENYLLNSNRTFFTPENGDNNDGCSMFLIDLDDKKVKGCLFTPGHLEGEYWSDKSPTFKPFTVSEYVYFYYNNATQKEPNFKKEFTKHFKIINNTSIDLIDQSELNQLCGKEVKSNISDILMRIK